MIRMLSTIMPVSLHGARAETTRIASSGASRVCNSSAAPDAIRSMSSLSSGSTGTPRAASRRAQVPPTKP